MKSYKKECTLQFCGQLQCTRTGEVRSASCGSDYRSKKKKKSCGSTCNASSALPSCFMLALLSNTGTLRQGKTSRRSLWPPLHFCRLAICLVAKVVSIISATWFTESYKEPARARHALHEEERASINYKAC